MKSVLRQTYKAKRTALINQIDYHSALLNNLQQLFSQLSLSSLKAIGTYKPLPKQIIPPPTYKLTDATPAYPVHYPGSRVLVFKEAVEQTNFRKAEYGILVPREDRPTCRPDVILVPLLCFDSQKNRIGYGGGYYDATIKDYRRQKEPTVWIGIGLEGLKTDLIPAEECDQRLDYVVTESHIYS